MKKRSSILILVVTVICCLAMALVDGVLRHQHNRLYPAKIELLHNKLQLSIRELQLFNLK